MLILDNPYSFLASTAGGFSSVFRLQKMPSHSTAVSAEVSEPVYITVGAHTSSYSVSNETKNKGSCSLLPPTYHALPKWKTDACFMQYILKREGLIGGRDGEGLYYSVTGAAERTA